MPELSWWREDAARWELLDFAGQHTEDGLPFDARWEDRQQVLEALIHDPLPGDGAFARYLLRQETSAHGHMWGFNHSIELAALLVARQRRIEDVWLLWAATCRSFDTWCGLPHRLLLAGGASATPVHVRDADHPQREDLLEYLQELSDVIDDDVGRVPGGPPSLLLRDP